jgi:hypothetical protein
MYAPPGGARPPGPAPIMPHRRRNRLTVAGHPGSLRNDPPPVEIRLAGLSRTRWLGELSDLSPRRRVLAGIAFPIPRSAWEATVINLGGAGSAICRPQPGREAPGRRIVNLEREASIVNLGGGCRHIGEGKSSSTPSIVNPGGGGSHHRPRKGKRPGKRHQLRTEAHPQRIRNPPSSTWERKSERKSTSSTWERKSGRGSQGGEVREGKSEGKSSPSSA